MPSLPTVRVMRGGYDNGSVGWRTQRL